MNLQLRKTKLPIVKQAQNTKSALLLITVVALFVQSCAAVKGPSGGPVDTTPPEVITISPANRSLHFKGGKISIEFSEYLDERTVDNAIRISPLLSGRPEFVLRKKTLLFDFPEDLIQNQTYVITLGRTLTDEHGVSLAQPVQIAYSTGNTIDEGNISGRIFSANSFSAHLWKIDPTTINDSLFAEKPHFVSEADDNGNYKFQFLASGNYKILAIDNRMTGLPLIPSRMEYGLPWVYSVSLDTSQSVSGIHMMPFSEPEDFRIIKGNWLGPDWGQVTLNRAVPKGSRIGSAYIMPESGIPVNAKTYLDPLDSSMVQVQIAHPAEPGVSSIVIESILLGDSVLMNSGKLDVRVPAAFDTAEINWNLPKRMTNLQPGKESQPYLDCIISHPVIFPKDISKNIRLEDSDSLEVEVKIKIISPFHFKMLPIEGWGSDEKYKLTILGERLHTTSGESIIDSVSIFSISVSDYPSFGSLEGRISGSRKDKLLVVASSAEKELPIATSVVNSDNVFTFEKLPEGLVRLMVFQDSDMNNQYSHGSAIPHKQAEWFAVVPDTFEVRANWDKVISAIHLGEVD